MNMPKKSIGILGGMGPLATADLFRKIVTLTDAARDNDHIRIYIDDNATIPDRTAAILEGGPSPLPAMTESLRKLESCGADCLVMPCNTAHYFLPQLQSLTKVPFLSMLQATAAACRDQFPDAVAGVLATRGTLKAGLYQQALEDAGVPFQIPEEEEQDALMRVIYDGVKAGKGPEVYGADMNAVVEALGRRGAGYFILGCTELPLAAEQMGLIAPTVDPTEELAKAAIRFCGYWVRE